MMMYTLWAVLVIATSPGGVHSEYRASSQLYTAEQCNEKQMSMGVTKPIEGLVVVYECRAEEVL